ncbi:uncharacterized protein BDZ83DRAFT_84078 [Colletotrichum acutatum]|uniref:Uncharacterized protein n=1 Tax=Glomerella acutata TaxID=27357 RepID=A0AAD8XB04_GLOAC|nr:uncharacterized protein BDZ83DRAFT_84078 [Colletotrichum acutatum]KAK1713370.1 hypothetical protein BDZ83DRAFT_84078 [Colletotrichum acutatum]
MMNAPYKQPPNDPPSPAALHGPKHPPALRSPHTQSVGAPFKSSNAPRNHSMRHAPPPSTSAQGLHGDGGVSKPRMQGRRVRSHSRPLPIVSNVG